MPSASNPVFVKIDEVKDVLATLNSIKSKINQANETLAEIGVLKEKEFSEIENWKSSLQEVSAKVASIDRVLFEKEV